MAERCGQWEKGRGHCDVKIPGSGAYNDGGDQRGGPVFGERVQDWM